VSVGSNDMRTWFEFGESIYRTSVGELYDTHEKFNHPPLMGLMASLAYAAAGFSGIRFEWLFKLPSVVADLGAALLLYQRYGGEKKTRAAGAFAHFCCNPASILITAYHGNTDSLCASLMLLAVLLLDAKRYGASGLALAASINVKLVPVLLIAPLLACAGDRRQRLSFLGALALGAIPFLPYIIGHWSGFHAHALAYRSHARVWGITFVAAQIGGLEHVGGAGKAIARFWVAKGTFVVLGWPLVLAALKWSKRIDFRARELAASSLMAFLVFTPGFGIQYLVYPAGLLLAVSLAQGARFAVASGLHAFVMYASLWTGTRPYYSDFRVGQPLGALIVGLLPWAGAAHVRFELMLRRERAKPLYSA
jgi:hypothetical protein